MKRGEGKTGKNGGEGMNEEGVEYNGGTDQIDGEGVMSIGERERKEKRIR